MALQAKFISGDPIMVPYTPSGAVAAGDVIVSGSRTFIAHLAIAANTLGAVAAGGGVYEAVKVGTGGNDFTMGEKLYWDDSNNVIDDGSSGNTFIGWASEDAAALATTGRFIHGAATA
jgi:predicted RecA/RadA family phage recombinase